MYKLKAYLPGLQKYIFVKELNYKTYRNLVKSLYTGDKIKTIELFNLILQDLTDEADIKNITLIDKLAIFLTIREVCVGPDLKLNCTCPNTSNQFNFQVAISDIQNTLAELITHIKTETKELKSKFNTFLLVKDEVAAINIEQHSILAAFLTDLTTDKNINLIEYSVEDKKTILKQLPLVHLQGIEENFKQSQIHNGSKKLLQIISPFTKEIIYEVDGNLNPGTLCNLLEYLFTEDLNNVYKAMYNVVTHCKFSAEYIDSITPAEIQVYWGYFIEENKQQNNSSSPTTNIPSTNSTEFGFG